MLNRFQTSALESQTFVLSVQLFSQK